MKMIVTDERTSELKLSYVFAALRYGSGERGE